MLAFIHESPFYELAALLALAAGVGFIGVLLRQPLIVSFIAVGMLAGPSVMGIVQSHESIELLSKLGIAVLLFLVGLKLDIKLIRTLGPVALATGLGQVAFTSAIGFVIGLMLGFDMITAVYVAVALTFSSTIIIVKLLSDKREIDSLHGRIALGFLIVQDVVVVIAMLVLAALGAGEKAGGDAGTRILMALGYGTLIIVAVVLFVRYVAEWLVSRIARSTELLMVFAIAWAAMLAATGQWLGFSMELGGLLAGISLASTPYREAIVARLSALRDFLLLFFFIALGSQLELTRVGEQVGPALLFSAFVLIGNPIIVLAIMGFMGFRKRTGFLAGLTVAQISEFSFIFVAMGVTLGHVASDALGLVTVVGVITIALSVYMITYSQALYRWIEPALGLFERKSHLREVTPEEGQAAANRYDLVLVGLGRYGSALADRLGAQGTSLLAVDFNPDEVRRWRAQGFTAVYGDACDHEFIDALPLDGVRWVIAALPQHGVGLTHDDPRLMLIDGLRRRRFGGRIAVATHRAEEVDALRDRGADVVFLPFEDAADRAVRRLAESTDA